jgi:hypothetical protein
VTGARLGPRPGRQLARTAERQTESSPLSSVVWCAEGVDGLSGTPRCDLLGTGGRTAAGDVALASRDHPLDLLNPVLTEQGEHSLQQVAR